VKTKDRIIKKALSLFNQNGVYNVSTNHIAQALDMSPGNLYYHFKDKEDIVRSIYDQMIEFMDKVWVTGKQPDPASSIVDIIAVTMRLQYKYRFFYREIGVLLEKDPILRKKYCENRQERLEKMLVFLTESQIMGSLIESGSRDKQYLLLETIWFIIEWGIQHGLVLKQLSAKELITSNIKMLILFISPYLSPEAKVMLEQKIK